MDVINAAKKISEAGSKLDKLCRQIADQVNNVQLQITKRSKCHLKVLFIISMVCCLFQCPDSASKKDLLAYLQRIALYCHQLNITSKVKADVQNISGELIVSGVSLFTVPLKTRKLKNLLRYDKVGNFHSSLTVQLR